MIYLRGLAIGAGIYAFCWGAYYAGSALADSEYLDAFFFVFWLAYCLFAGVLISKNIGRRA